jgi:hypothetical protein
MPMPNDMATAMRVTTDLMTQQARDDVLAATDLVHRTSFLPMHEELMIVMTWRLVAMCNVAVVVAAWRGIRHSQPDAVDFMFFLKKVGLLGLMRAAVAKGLMSIGRAAALGSMPMTRIEDPSNRGCSHLAPPTRGRPSILL